MDPVTHPSAPLGGREGVERAPGVAPLAGVGLATLVVFALEGGTVASITT